MDWTGLILGGLGFAAGGVLKGATGAGAPLLAVPILALLYDVPLAVALFTIPNLASNLWQGWAFRRSRSNDGLTLRFTLGALLGVFLGSLALASAPPQALFLLVAVLVLTYVAFRVARPEWRLSRALGLRLSLAAGALGGFLQGAAGLSAPVSVTFLNSMRLERGEFIGTIAIFFGAMSVVQIPTLAWFGILTWERLGLSVLAAVALFGAMPLGSALARRVSKETFDRIILAVLVLIALRLIGGILL